MDNPVLQAFEAALSKWDDQRFITRDQLRAVAKFTMYLVNLADDGGWIYRGHSFKQTDYMGCLVVKADIDGTPQVVFTNGRTYTGCIVGFIRRLEAEELQWRPDKYR